MNTVPPNQPDDLAAVLVQRDELIATSAEFEVLRAENSIENDAIRELGRIVMESTPEPASFYSCT